MLKSRACLISQDKREVLELDSGTSLCLQSEHSCHLHAPHKAIFKHTLWQADAAGENIKNTQGPVNRRFRLDLYPLS